MDNVDFDSKTSFIGVNLNEINFTLAALIQESALGQARIINLERKRPILAAFLRISCDYGPSFPRFFFWCLAVIIFFILAYNFLPASLVRADNLIPSGGIVG
ncbi:hypothetical protein NDI37_17955 [Funiculus sociatus GB2-A5]|uniref:Uncharacterized protein n=1 Tax=Funiculus sociatus GB2-A5 TaxID=2933946 RepID=A0ABV0JSC8_9CYAN|nr:MULTISPECIES: hypothetical protein [unclassified Trichocoleus]MBD1908942.1 hypothetical protein [Trichocoleus sp. FACHB-832]MBD2064590.1 hypothetical protein [Trichocoleus sp. FACHB-6]